MGTTELMRVARQPCSGRYQSHHSPSPPPLQNIHTHVSPHVGLPGPAPSGGIGEGHLCGPGRQLAQHIRGCRADQRSVHKHPQKHLLYIGFQKEGSRVAVLGFSFRAGTGQTALANGIWTLFKNNSKRLSKEATSALPLQQITDGDSHSKWCAQFSRSTETRGATNQYACLG